VKLQLPDAPARDGVKEYDLHEIQAALGITKRGVEIRAEKEGWPFTLAPGRGRFGGKRLYRPADLPDDVSLALQRRYAPIVPVHPAQTDPTYTRGYGEVGHISEAMRAEAWAYWQRLTGAQRAVGVARWEALREVQALVDAGTALLKARALVGRQRGMSAASLARWAVQVGDAPTSDWQALLVNRKKTRSGRKPWAQCDEVVWTWFKDHWLSRAQPSWADAYRRVREMSDAQGWACPGLKWFKQRLRREVPYQERVVRREGPMAIRRLLPVQVRDALCFASGQAVNGDGVTFRGMWMRFEDGECIKGGKAWVWQDIRTRRYLAWRLGKSENTDVFRLATYDLTAVCAPEEAWVDNTRAAANKTMTAGAKHRHRFKSDPNDGQGLLAMLGIELNWTSPNKETGNPGSKPIERSFGIGGIREMVLNNPRIIAAGSGRTRETAIDVALVREVMDEEVRRFNAQLGRRTQACNGVLSFDQAWDEGLKGYVPRVLTAEQRGLLLMSREVVKLPSDRGQMYLKAGRGPYGARNAYWTPGLADYEGERVVVLYDPEDLHKDVQVYTLDGDFICMAEHMPGGAFKSESVGRDWNRLLTREATAIKRAAKAGEAMDAIERGELYVAAVGVGADAADAPAGAGAATGATEAGGARVVQGHFQQTPGRRRKGRAKGAGGGAVVAFPERAAAEVEAQAAARRALEAYTERLLEEKQALVGGV